MTATSQELVKLGATEYRFSPELCHCEMHEDGTDAQVLSHGSMYHVSRTNVSGEVQHWHDACASEGTLWRSLRMTRNDLDFSDDYGGVFIESAPHELGHLELPEPLKSYQSGYSTVSGESPIPDQMTREGFRLFSYLKDDGETLIACADDKWETEYLLEELRRLKHPEGDPIPGQKIILSPTFVHRRTLRSDIQSGNEMEQLRKTIFEYHFGRPGLAIPELIDMIIQTEAKYWEGVTTRDEVIETLQEAGYDVTL
ncbi:hypothetical protein EHS25_008336 [Saitozyma podzolica]|uniref:Uncharacterized protein n=1 Tax=Saitozyma podzolica TaxID=1890683 RepID=A0A427YPA9_9TREE|nr:hypothetical protein EHS25_008336 [Saitozyma podzolica]